ncbi:MAG: hypothetical protein J6P13_02540 [Kiritimatiellae bacterium]|nr:hypothetical protein [Kiritimatiellia bacterium]
MANLTQLRMLENLNAFLLVDKPAGIAFSTVVKTVKRKFNLVKVGHGGSLDAAASGLLVLLINDANKFTGDVMGADREYEGTIRLAHRTDTGDKYGNAIPAPGGELPSDEALAAALKEFKGDIFQKEPRFCSVRREGSAAYEVADTGEHDPFLVHVWRLDVAKTAQDALSYRVSATKGLIVRALADELGMALGTGAVLESCRRTRVGKFKVEDAIAFDRLLETEMKDFAQCTIPLGTALR